MDFQEEIDVKDKLKGDVKIPAPILTRRILGYVKPEWLRFSAAGLLILVNVVLDIILPLITKAITHNMTEGPIDLSRPCSWGRGPIHPGHGCFVFFRERSRRTKIERRGKK